VLLAGLSLVLVQAAHSRAAAQEVVQPWQHLGDTLAGIYGWPNVMFHVAAVAVTPALVYTADSPLQEHFQSNAPLTNDFAHATYITGWVVPIAVPATLYGGGLLAHDAELATGGAAAIQAVVVQAVVVSTLKWLTDRAAPFPNGNSHATGFATGLFNRNSKDPKDFNFNPFDLDGGLNWPSGHTAANFSLVSSLVAFYPDQIWIAAVGYPAAAAIAVGMIAGNYHWLSDVVAGALIGNVIGWVTGKEFRRAFDAQPPRDHAVTRATDVQLHVVPTGRGLMLAATF
jgi:membrane-associated phospholipid phosphatase